MKTAYPRMRYGPLRTTGLYLNMLKLGNRPICSWVWYTKSPPLDETPFRRQHAICLETP